MVIENVVYREALLGHLGISECCVKLHRIDVPHKTPKRKLLSTVSGMSARSHVIWLPSVASTKANSAAAMDALAKYQHSEVMAPAVKETNASYSNPLKGL